MFVQSLLQWKTISVSYSECLCVCVSVALVTQLEMCMRLIVTCSLPGSTLSHKRHDFLKKKVIENEICVLGLYSTYVWNISHSKKNWARYDKKCVLVFRWSTHYSCQILIKLEFCPQISETYSDIKYHESLSSGSWVVPCGRTDGRTDGQMNRQTWRS